MVLTTIKGYMQVVGYKAFNGDFTNRWGMFFEEGKTYQTSGEVTFGINSSNGFHMCTYLSDVFRFFDAINEDVAVAQVIGSGKIVEKINDDYDYFGMYSVEKITIKHFMFHDEIIAEMLKYHDINNLWHFLSTYKLTPEELFLFLEKFYENNIILGYLFYYQLGYKDYYWYNYEQREKVRDEYFEKALSRKKLI